jgi:epoxyqueuosine reductase
MMDALTERSSTIKAEAIRLGFSGCGISKAEFLPDDAKRLQQWLDSKYHAGMSYMENHFDKRTDPSRLSEGARSVISVILNYYSRARSRDPEAPVISTYAYGKDYHQVIRKKLNALLRFMQNAMGPVSGRGFVDSAPVLDRAWAARSGLGWIGKNSNLISPESGSFFFIGNLIVDIPLQYDKPITDFCGDCNRCIRACPTNAILPGRTINANRCISYLTIENRDEISPEFAGKFRNRAFGCDICQDVCPWNRKSTPNKEEDFKPLTGLLEMKRQEWYDLDEEKYSALFAHSAIKRAKFTGLKRNLDFIKMPPPNDVISSPPR